VHYRSSDNKRLYYGRGTVRQLVSRNSVTTKHPIKILESRVYRVALFADGWTDGQTDGRTDTRRQHVPRLA